VPLFAVAVWFVTVRTRRRSKASHYGDCIFIPKNPQPNTSPRRAIEQGQSFPQTPKRRADHPARRFENQPCQKPSGAQAHAGTDAVHFLLLAAGLFGTLGSLFAILQDLDLLEFLDRQFQLLTG
jgi:hypothetical protein